MNIYGKSKSKNTVCKTIKKITRRMIFVPLLCITIHIYNITCIRDRVYIHIILHTCRFQCVCTEHPCPHYFLFCTWKVKFKLKHASTIINSRPCIRIYYTRWVPYAYTCVYNLYAYTLYLYGGIRVTITKTEFSRKTRIRNTHSHDRHIMSIVYGKNRFFRQWWVYDR